MAPKYLFNCLNVPNEFSKYVLRNIIKERSEKVRKWKSENVRKREREKVRNRESEIVRK